jgi:hypothetical protein
VLRTPLSDDSHRPYVDALKREHRRNADAREQLRIAPSESARKRSVETSCELTPQEALGVKSRTQLARRVMESQSRNR